MECARRSGKWPFAFKGSSQKSRTGISGAGITTAARAQSVQGRMGCLPAPVMSRRGHSLPPPSSGVDGVAQRKCAAIFCLRSELAETGQGLVKIVKSPDVRIPLISAEPLPIAASAIQSEKATDVIIVMPFCPGLPPAAQPKGEENRPPASPLIVPRFVRRYQLPERPDSHNQRKEQI